MQKSNLQVRHRHFKPTLTLCLGWKALWKVVGEAASLDAHDIPTPSCQCESHSSAQLPANMLGKAAGGGPGVQGPTTHRSVSSWLLAPGFQWPHTSRCGHVENELAMQDQSITLSNKIIS